MDGTFYPAYCMNRDRSGADNSNSQTINLMELLKDSNKYNKVWRVVVAGYPYHTAQELGVSDWRYAYQATKTAIYCVLGQADVNNYYGDDTEGKETAALIRKLVNEGNNGTATYKNPVTNVAKSGNMTLQGNYYVQNYKVTSNVQITTYDVAITKFPTGTKVTNTKGIEKDTFSAGEVFQLRLPKESVETSDINGRIRTDVNTKSYALFYGKTYDETLQNYAVTGDPISMRSGTVNLNLKGNTASIKIKKVDEDTNESIEGTKYQLEKSDGTIIGTGKTDKNGILTFNNLYQDNYVIKEIKSNDDYIISQETIDIRATYNKVTEITLSNEHKKGNIKVYKVDKDNNKVTLGNVEFDLYSEEFNRVIGTYKTDVNGEIFIENLRTGNYKLIEKNTNKWYNLAEDTDIKVEWDETKPYTIENELKKGQVKIIKVDKDNNEIKLEGIKFEVLDRDGRVLENVVTNENGEAYTKEYAIRDFETITIREVETLDNYKLDDTLHTIELKANDITTIELTNEVKKGQIKIIKVDKDNNQIKLKDVKFEVYDNENNLIQTLITDENGEAITDRLPIDKEYIIKEIETNEDYVLNEEPITVTLKEDEIKELTFENELKKGQIKVVKVDSEDNEIYIPDTTFEIYNSKDELVDTIITDANGEAISKRLPINDEYTMRETISNKAYVLNEDVQKVILQENEIKDVVFENTKIYGKIKINKVSSNYSKILDLPANSPLANTKFLVTNSQGEVMGIYTTDENGSVITGDLPYGEYIVYEYETPEHFIKDATPQKVLITENNQITELTFKNAPVEPKLPKTGF